MNRYIMMFSVLIVAILMSGCAQKVTIRVLEPAEIDRAATTKKIAVTEFKNDKVGLSSKIESNLSRYKIASKPFFTMVNRSDINKIIKEQKLQNSGLVDTSTIVEVGNLMGAEAIISGKVAKISSSDTRFYERRSRCADQKCKELIYYKVRCTKRDISLSADIRMIDITVGDIIYSENLSKRASYKHCSDDSRSLPSKESVARNMATSMASNFTHKLTPHYKYIAVELLEDPDLDYDDTQEELLENALLYIEHNRLKKAENLLGRLVYSTNQQSYVALYNLGVVKEAQAEYLKAREYYTKADELTIEPIKAIDYAYMRINSIIEKSKLTQSQINR